MLKVVTTFIEQHRLLPARGHVVVAVSGGADSLCLLHLLHTLCGPSKRYPAVTLHVAHLNHQLRAAASDADAQAVATLAHSWELDCVLGSVDVPALARLEQRSLEDAARTARYRFLRSLAARLDDPPARIAVAHHRDDQVETQLLHWLRGGGLASVVGLQPLQRAIIRPLLTVTHADTLAYCQQHQLVPLEDASNMDTRFLRNRIRHELLPLLEAINPGFRNTLLRNAEVMQTDLLWIESQVDSYWPQIVQASSHEALTLSRPALLALPLSIQRHLLRRVTSLLSDGQSPLELRHYRLIEEMLHQGQEHGSMDLPHHLRLLRQHDLLVCTSIKRATSELLDHQNSEVTLPIPGRVTIPGTPWQAIAEEVSPQQAAYLREAVHTQKQGSSLSSETPYTVYINGDQLADTLQVRTRRPGDRLQPLGMAHTKKVQDILVDRHIARSERASIPLFFSQQHCIWLAGIQIDDRVRLTSETKRILRLTIER